MTFKTFHHIALPATLVVLLTCLPGVAIAHAGHAHTAGFNAGLTHPIGGLDHVLAMAAVGALGFQMGGRALWGLPAVFLSMMVVGGLLGMVHVPTLLIEAGIVTSVVVLGAMLNRVLRPAAPLVIALVAIFALFHGYAHGAEMPATADAVAYAAGFLIATATLHTVGAVGALAVHTVASPRAASTVD